MKKSSDMEIDVQVMVGSNVIITFGRVDIELTLSLIHISEPTRPY